MPPFHIWRRVCPAGQIYQDSVFGPMRASGHVFVNVRAKTLRWFIPVGTWNVALRLENWRKEKHYKGKVARL